MTLIILLLALYLGLGAALATFVLLWLLANRLGLNEVRAGRGILLAPAYRRRLLQLAKGPLGQVTGRALLLLVYALLAWPWLFLALFCEKTSGNGGPFNTPG